jgi:very-short-patch-repair endonuclease
MQDLRWHPSALTRATMARRFRPHEQKSQRFAKSLRKQMTDAEVILWSYLRREALTGLRFRRQHPIGPYAADFACMKVRLIVEVDGATHSTADEIRHDRIRDGYLRHHGWRVLRVTNDDVYKNLSGVIDAIIHCARIRRPPTSRPPMRSARRPGDPLPPQAGGET